MPSTCKTCFLLSRAAKAAVGVLLEILHVRCEMLRKNIFYPEEGPEDPVLAERRKGFATCFGDEDVEAFSCSNGAEEGLVNPKPRHSFSVPSRRAIFFGERFVVFFDELRSAIMVRQAFVACHAWHGGKYFASATIFMHAHKYCRHIVFDADFIDVVFGGIRVSGCNDYRGTANSSDKPLMVIENVLGMGNHVWILNARIPVEKLLGGNGLIQTDIFRAADMPHQVAFLKDIKINKVHFCNPRP
ncbi:MAG: hypothetical protein ACD_3C00057G0006 [uncultured bacterium (gcode 4)]|uniref:Uncharacterized protein n=1 Tax=uncultured bacterium (gcode 4) TaxID=1234023 RepID=K2FBF0_9BACT|nr:MAG: hypothetical protein ACD_3C00057G0006 [uncultured bacterium (gcode 4)]